MFVCTNEHKNPELLQRYQMILHCLSRTPNGFLKKYDRGVRKKLKNKKVEKRRTERRKR